jgi:hypothetical protein
VLFLLFGVGYSCQKEGKTLAVKGKELNSATVGCGSQLDSAYKKIDEMGEVFYTHLKLHMGVVAPEKYLPSSIQAIFKAKFDSLWNIHGSASFSDVLNVSIGTTQKVQPLKNKLLALKTTLTSAYASGNTPTGSMLEIKGMDEDMKSSSGFSCEEKAFLHLNFVLSQKLLAYMAYESPLGYMPQNIVSERGGDEVWKNCFWNIFATDFLKGLSIGAWSFVIVGGLVSLFDGAQPSSPTDPLTGTPTNGIKIPFTGVGIIVGAVIFVVVVVVAAIAGLIHGLVGANDCAFDIKCQPPIGISTSWSSCNPTVTFTPWGITSCVQGFGWLNTNCNPIAVSTTSPNNSVTLTQIDPLKPFIAIATPLCSCNNNTSFGGSTTESMNLFDLVKSIGFFDIVGASYVNTGQTATYEMAFIGNNNYQFTVVNGTILSQDATGITVIWNGVGKNHPGKIIVTATNTCPGGAVMTKTFPIGWIDPTCPTC